MGINMGTSSSVSISGSEAPGHCHDLIIVVKDNKTKRPSLAITWKDSYEGVWGGTKVLFKKTNPPRNDSDGTLIANSTEKHLYANEPLIYQLPEGSTTGKYHITLFPYSVSGILNDMRVSTNSVNVTVM